MKVIGPALGGVMIAVFGAGETFSCRASLTWVY